MNNVMSNSYTTFWLCIKFDQLKKGCIEKMLTQYFLDIGDTWILHIYIYIYTELVPFSFCVKWQWSFHTLQLAT